MAKTKLTAIDVKPIEPNSFRFVNCIRAVDGDTVVVNINLGMSLYAEKQPLRLCDVYAPETKGAEKAFGLIIESALHTLVAGQELLYTKLDQEKDNRGRWLGVIFIRSSVFLRQFESIQKIIGIPPMTVKEYMKEPWVNVNRFIIEDLLQGKKYGCGV